MDGFYDAVVADIADPMQRGRVRLQIPQVSGTAVTGWAQPMSAGWVNIGDQVFATFKGGDPHYPLFIPRSGVSPWLPLVLDPAFVPTNLALVPSVRVTSDGCMTFSGVLMSVLFPPTGSDTVFATLPAGVPAPLYGQFQVSATETPPGFASRTTVAASAAAGTTASTSYSATLAGAADPGPTVVFTAPGSGEVAVTVGMMAWNSVDGHGTYMAARVTSGGAGGATVLAESDDRAALEQGTNRASVVTSFPVTGLSPGGAYSVTAMYRSSITSNTANADNRFVRVDPVYPYSTPVVRVSVHTDRTLTAWFPQGSDTATIDLSGVRARYA